MTVSEIVRLLAREYGERPWQPHHDPVSELVLAILSQNTSDINSGSAFNRLGSKFGNWEAAANAAPEEIEASIRSAGLSKVKASRIKAALQNILAREGSLDLDFLRGLSLPEAKKWLRQLPGVGPKTAACVLLFSLGKPALPVDTHLYRVSKRLGLINSRVSPEKAHEILEGMVPSEVIYQFHLNMIEHGRRVCHSKRPKCEECTLSGECPSSFIGIGSDEKRGF